MDERLPRRLAAILYADVVEYSRLTGEDEDTTHRTLSEYLDRIATNVERHGGRVMHYAGDAVLAMFEAVIDALACAARIQHDLRARNEDVPDARKVQFRIGLNMGDVIEDRGDIYGDGVNVAARLEGLAEPGGICVSESVRTAVGSKLPFDYEFMGEQSVKNIAEPVRAYHARVTPGASLPEPSVRPTTYRRKHHVMGATAAAAVLVFGAGVVAWWQSWQPGGERASEERMAFPLPDRPSIAVLPFTNLSDDEEQEYFADGMTEDLITDLSKISGLFVIARNSVFKYKDRPIRIRQVAEELGVRYVMEGSVRRVGDEVRINVQLIDATTEGHLWAERYDGTLRDIFSLQDQVTGNIVAALELTLTDAEQVELARLPTTSLEAYDYYLRANRGHYTFGSKGRREKLSLYQKAVSLDPQFADAYAGIAWVASLVWRYGESEVLPGPVARKVAYGAASKALSLDPGNAQAYSVLASLQVADGKYSEALESVEKAVVLQPNNAEIYTNLAGVLVYTGRHAEALSAMKTAFRLEPKPPPIFYADLGWVLFWNRQYEQAVEPLEKALEGGIEWWELAAMIYAKSGRPEEAKAMLDKVYQVWPGASLAYYRAAAYHKRPEDVEHSLAALRAAGMHEWPLGYGAPVGDRLDPAAVEALTFGRTWVGKDLMSGGSFALQFGSDGRIAYRGADSLVTGTAWLEDGQLCVDYPALGATSKSCNYLYRNPEGSPEEHNEYIHVGLYQTFTFSVRP